MSDYKNYGFSEDMIAEMLYFLDWCVGHDAAFDGMTVEEWADFVREAYAEGLENYNDLQDYKNNRLF